MIQRTATTMVRGFFDAYFTGLLEARLAEGAKREPRLLKQLVAERYETVGTTFTQTLLPVLLGLTFESYEAAVADMRARHFSDSTPLKLLLRHACGSRETYEAVVAEYRHQMQTLLSGHIEAPSDFIVRQPTTAATATGAHLRALVRTVMSGYAQGVRHGGKAALKQPTVFRLMGDAAATLLHSQPIDVWAEMDTRGLDGVYSRVCRTQDNYETLLAEMSQAYEDLAAS